MKCKKAKKLIIKYLGDEEQCRKTGYLKEHLTRCSQCREYKKRTDKIFSSIDKFTVSASAPEGFTERTTARAWLSPSRERFRGRRVVLAAFAGAAAAVILLFTLLPRRPQEEVFWMASAPHAEKMLADFTPNSRFYASEVGYIKVNLRSAASLEGVKVNIELPEGLELYDGRRRIENWKVDLNQGDNVVFLKVKPHQRGIWSLEGVIEKDGARSRFSKKVEVI